MEDHRREDNQSSSDLKKIGVVKFVRPKDALFEFILLAVAAIYVLTELISGFNFLVLPGVVLAMVIGLISFIILLTGRDIGIYAICAYLTLVVGTFLATLIWGADDFGKRLWWTLVISLFPMLLSGGYFLIRGSEKLKKLLAACLTVLIIGANIAYFLFATLRFRPTVERMWEGHDEYLKQTENKSTVSNAPNVLFILMDDMAYSDISLYSGLYNYYGADQAAIHTPNIDSLADNGVFLDNFYASAPVCTPSRFSSLTGRYASRGYLDNVIFPTVTDNETFSPTHFVNPYQFAHNVDGILGDEITMAEALRALGYDTSCIGKWNLGDYGEYLPMNQGFDYFYGSYYVNDMTPYTWVEEKDGEVREIKSHKDNLDQSLSTGQFTDKIIETMSESVEEGNNFFMWYTSPWPHFPIFSDDNGNGLGDKTDDSYVQCIQEFDKSLGEIFDYMKSTVDADGNTLYDNTVIIFTSDNGPGREGVTGGLRGRKNTTFDGGMKVPFIISYPNGSVGKGDAVADISYSIVDYDGSDTGRACVTKCITSSAMLTDIFPTVMHYVTGSDDNMPTDRVIDGVSLVDLVSGTQASDTRVHDALFYHKKGGVQAVQMPVEVDGKTYDFKYYDSVRTENSAFIDQVYKNYLFNLDRDPAEGYNLSMTHPEVAETLKARLKEFRAELSDNRRGIKK